MSQSTHNLCVTEHTHFVCHRAHTFGLSQSTHSPCVTEQVDMGWLRLVGVLEWGVSYAGYSFFYKAFLQKRPIILCVTEHTHFMCDRAGRYWHVWLSTSSWGGRHWAGWMSAPEHTHFMCHRAGRYWMATMSRLLKMRCLVCSRLPIVATPYWHVWRESFMCVIWLVHVCKRDLWIFKKDLWFWGAY